MKRQCRWGILGTGKIARTMALALRESAAGRLVAVASRDPARAREFASLFHPTRYDLYVIEVDAVNGFVQDGQTCHPLMGWDESQANMRTLDRWREAVGLHYGEDRQAEGGFLQP